MNALALIVVGGKRYQFFHNNDTDGRELYDQEENLIMTIDSNLAIAGPEGKIGDMCVEGITHPKWVLYYGPNRTRFETGVDRDRLGRQYCWENLERAEVLALTHLLEASLPKRQMDELINCMEAFGWRDSGDGEFTHDGLGMTYPNWIAAIKCCIGVACEGANDE